MATKIKLRWLRRERRVTAEQVRAYQDAYDVSLEQAMHELKQDATTTTLQALVPYDAFGNGTWQDIPTVVEYE